MPLCAFGLFHRAQINNKETKITIEMNLIEFSYNKMLLRVKALWESRHYMQI